MNSYNLSRIFFDFCFENPEKVKPNHIAVYFFAIEHCNRLGWQKKFGFPTEMAKSAVGIRSYNTYIKTLNDLVSWGFIKMIERSKNQFSSNIIALSNFDESLDKALDKAIVKHVTKQSESTGESICSINKPLTNNLITLYVEREFLNDWNELRSKFLKIASNRNRIGHHIATANFKDLTAKYSKEEFRQAMEGLFRQQVIPNGNQVMLSDPKHLLENFDRYLTAYQEKNSQLYGKKQTTQTL